MAHMQVCRLPTTLMLMTQLTQHPSDQLTNHILAGRSSAGCAAAFLLYHAVCSVPARFLLLLDKVMG
jgi:hypothetical protein